MRWVSQLRMRLRSLFRKDHMDRELDAELQFFIDQHASALVAQGVTADDARRQALEDAGSLIHLREACRDARRVSGIEELAEDVREGIRGLARHPGYTLTSVGLIAIGIGMTCSAFALMDAVLLRTLPGAEHPERLVQLAGLLENDDHRGQPLPLYEQIAADREQVSHVFAFRSYGALPTSIGSITTPMRGIGLLGEYFDGLGAVPIVRGTSFAPDEDRPVAVISFNVWQARFAGAEDVIGRTFTLGYNTFTIVGVAGADFVGTQPDLAFDFLAPFVTLNRARGLTPAATRNQQVVTSARLKPGVTLEQYQARLSAAWPRLLRETQPPDVTADAWRRQWGGRVLAESLASGLAFTLITNPGLERALTLTVGLALLIFATSCVTIALLVVARSVRQQRHVAVRLSLGGSRWRIIRPELVGCAGISILGAAVGLAIARLGSSSAAEFVPGDWKIAVDAPVLAMALAMAAITALVGGAVGFYLSGRASLRDLLQSTGHTGRSHVRLRTVFLALQLALAVILVHSTIQYVRDLVRLTRVDAGVNADNLHVFLLAGRLPQRTLDTDYFQAIDTAVKTLPGVEAGALGGASGPSSFLRDLVQPIDTDDHRELNVSIVCVFPGVFEAWQTPLLQGRELRWTDGPAALVTKNLAERLAVGGTPLSRWVHVRAPARDYEIVGVVKNMAYNGPRLGQRDILFVPCLEQTKPWPSGYSINIYVRSRTRPLDDIGREVGAIVDRLGAQYVWSMDEQGVYVAGAMEQERMLATVSTSFGGTVILLTAIGLYAFCSYMLTFRGRELAIRAGLGASPRQIAAALLRETLLILSAGLVVGTAGIVVLRRLLASLVTGIGPITGNDLLQVTMLVSMVVLLASMVPTMRALKMDLASTLRLD